MKATGIVKRVDDLGRIVLPKELREQLGIYEGDQLEMYVDTDDGLVLRKYDPGSNIERMIEDWIEYHADVDSAPKIKKHIDAIKKIIHREN